MADWREELKNAYDKSADEKVKQSDAVYQKKMAQVLGDALSRGLGRSSYAAATQANLLNDMNEAGNQIRTDFRLEYLKALQQRELEEAQLAENRRQFDLKLAASAAPAYDYSSPGSYYPRPETPGSDTENNNNNKVNWWNVINSYEQKKTQSYVNTPGKATYSPTGLATVGLGKYSTRTTR